MLVDGENGVIAGHGRVLAARKLGLTDVPVIELAGMTEAQRLGGLRRKREKPVATAYSVDGLRDVDQLRRVLEIALVDTLSLANGVPRNRTLGSLTMAALKALETGELEERLAALEAAIQGREAPPVFDAEPE